MESFATWEAYRKMSSSSSVPPKSKSGKSWCSLFMWKVFAGYHLLHVWSWWYHPYRNSHEWTHCTLTYGSYKQLTHSWSLNSQWHIFCTVAKIVLFAINFTNLCHICGKLLYSRVPHINQYYSKQTDISCYFNVSSETEYRISLRIKLTRP